MTQESVWKGFRRLDFSFEGMDAILVFPEVANQKKNWLLKTEYFGAFPAFEVKMLERGFHLAFVKNITRWCTDEDLDRKKRFGEYLHDTYGLAPTCVPVGMSCGGLIACKLAARHPQLVSALYLDAPVMNLLSCPAGLGKAGNELMAEFVEVTGMTMSELICYRQHPIDQMHLLLSHKIPIIMVYGDSDTVVPYCENGALLEKFYQENGGELIAIGKEGCGHHPHSLTDLTPLVAFVEAHC